MKVRLRVPDFFFAFGLMQGDWFRRLKKEGARAYPRRLEINSVWKSVVINITVGHQLILKFNESDDNVINIIVIEFKDRLIFGVAAVDVKHYGLLFVIHKKLKSDTFLVIEFKCFHNFF